MRAVRKDEKLLQILLLEYKETIKLGFTAILCIDCKLFALLFITQYLLIMILVRRREKPPRLKLLTKAVRLYFKYPGRIRRHPSCVRRNPENSVWLQ